MFEILKTEGKARRGVFTCAHGTVQTPVFMNVGTQAAIKGGLSAEDLKIISAPIDFIGVNVYQPSNAMFRKKGDPLRLSGAHGPDGQVRTALYLSSLSSGGADGG